ncbi:MAG: DNA gyrase inhibitor YacG [Silicimonas sp.]|nr:DNA gyrase inhibitor YacG [Silicimonas sp.]MBT8424545.1 DNA gyrase inhibitor YacG [Silicimonas sp.]NND17706.1 DNA gyrase inhibitor YacG [Silicimonas sp.]NND22336.1 DNA gyrase inhibitor YacG [Silicimonas sp.]RZW02007.1 MAG: DNA gyrase inhibitor YacG [Paracoccaceae bacterium]
MSCPICQKPASPDYRPFCSKRCADVDLAHWLRGTYALPAEAATGAETDAEDASDDPRKPH